MEPAAGGCGVTRLMPLLVLLAACAPEPVTEWPEGPVIVPPAAALSQCADPARWHPDHCNNPRPG